MIEGHVPPETYEAKLEAAGVPSEKPDVKQFLDNMTYDRWYLLLAWIIFAYFLFPQIRCDPSFQLGSSLA